MSTSARPRGSRTCASANRLAPVCVAAARGGLAQTKAIARKAGITASGIIDCGLRVNSSPPLRTPTTQRHNPVALALIGVAFMALVATAAVFAKAPQAVAPAAPIAPSASADNG